jgi:hypothetical protein
VVIAVGHHSHSLWSMKQWWDSYCIPEPSRSECGSDPTRVSTTTLLSLLLLVVMMIASKTNRNNGHNKRSWYDHDSDDVRHQNRHVGMSQMYHTIDSFIHSSVCERVCVKTYIEIYKESFHNNRELDSNEILHTKRRKRTRTIIP